MQAPVTLLDLINKKLKMLLHGDDPDAISGIDPDLLFLHRYVTDTGT